MNNIVLIRFTFTVRLEYMSMVGIPVGYKRDKEKRKEEAGCATTRQAGFNC